MILKPKSKTAPIHSSAPIREGFEELLVDYVTGIPEAQQRLLQASNSENTDLLQSEIHRLAGSLGLYGYPEIAAAFRKTLGILREGASLREMDQELRVLEELLLRIRARP